MEANGTALGEPKRNWRNPLRKRENVCSACGVVWITYYYGHREPPINGVCPECAARRWNSEQRGIRLH